MCESIYGANYLETMTLCKNYTKLRKNPKFISSWENTPFDGLERYPRGIKFRLKIEGAFSLNTSPNWYMADKSIHFTRFPATLEPKVLNAAWSVILSGPLGPHYIKIFTPYGYIYAHIYIFWPPSDFVFAQKSWSLSDWHHSSKYRDLNYYRASLCNNC